MNQSKFIKTFGPWAVVTGASAGIGRAFVEQLAQKGLNVVLVARRKSVLDDMTIELSQKYGIEVMPIVADLSDPKSYDLIFDATRDIDIGLVISNAGDVHMGSMVRIPLSKLEATLRLNTQAHLALAHHFSSKMLEGKRSGGLLFVASTAGFQGSPMVASYSGAKAYILNLGRALNYEFRHVGIRSTVLAPGPTSTAAALERKDIDVSNFPMPYMSAEDTAHAGLKGLMKNKPLVIPGFANRLSNRLMTQAMSTRMWGGMMEKMAPETLMLGDGKTYLPPTENNPLHQQKESKTMTATMVVTAKVNPNETEALKTYSSQVGPMVIGSGGRIVTNLKASEPLIGDGGYHVVAVIEFDAVETIKQVFSSPGYEALIPVRDKAFSFYAITICEPA